MAATTSASEAPAWAACEPVSTTSASPAAAVLESTTTARREVSSAASDALRNIPANSIAGVTTTTSSDPDSSIAAR